MSGQETSTWDNVSDTASHAYNTASDAWNWAAEGMEAQFYGAGAHGGPGSQSEEAKREWMAEEDRHNANAQYYFEKMKEDLGES